MNYESEMWRQVSFILPADNPDALPGPQSELGSRPTRQRSLHVMNHVTYTEKKIMPTIILYFL